MRTDVPVVGDAGEVLKLLIPEVEERRHDDWMAWIDSRRDRALDEALEERPDVARAVHDHQVDRRGDKR